MTAQLTRAHERVELFGVEVDPLTMDQTIDRAFEIAGAGVPTQHVVINAAKVELMSKDDALRQVIADCPIVNADGMSVVWASRLLGRGLPERVAGIDLFVGIVERAASTGNSVYFLGATDEVLSVLLDRFAEQYPDLQVAGSRNGYWDDDAEVVEAVSAAKPDFLFVAIPSPRKEFWLAEHGAALGVPFMMGVGGSFDVVAGKVRRAPTWVQRIGCEWVYRLLQEPRRMWRRYLVGNTRFFVLTMREWWQIRQSRRSADVRLGT
jgi:N-acetylglucosaminyldiphosphoundecaprenol N-acetyl-beta-D-mannosaminyltransferase